jgi:multiple sugar transport system ATP-binding protein
MGFLRIENLSKNFARVKALSSLDLELDEGTFCVALGPSGCGKSTLLNLIAGLEEPSSGRIYLAGRDITHLPPHKRDIAMVFQSYALYPHLSVYENMAFGLRIKRLKDDEIKRKVMEASKILNIEDKLSKFPRELSGGQRQRVATGRAIVRDPKLFLFDEPLSNLDARLRVELRAEFIRLHRRLKKTVVYVTHDQTEAMVLGEVVVVMKEGRIQQVSSPEGLYEQPKNLFVAEFIGSPPMNIVEFEVSAQEGRLMLARGDFRLEVPVDLFQKLGRYINRKIYLGVRPSGLELSGEGNLRAEINFIETIGEDSFAHIKFAQDAELTVRIQKNSGLKTGELVSLRLDWRKVHFFDNTGIRISA